MNVEDSVVAAETAANDLVVDKSLTNQSNDTRINNVEMNVEECMEDTATTNDDGNNVFHNNTNTHTNNEDMIVEDIVVASTSNQVQLSGRNNDLVDSSPTDTVPNDEDRPSCKFGRQCYRQNPRHRVDMAHPGDEDYQVPDMPEHSENAPKCAYGRKCYRLNPDHFVKYMHPRNINLQENYKKLYLNRKANRRNSSDSDLSEDDPFAGDSDDLDYAPDEDD